MLKTVTGETVELLSEVDAQVEHNDQRVSLPLIVMKGPEWSFVTRPKLGGDNSDRLALS